MDLNLLDFDTLEPPPPAKKYTERAPTRQIVNNALYDQQGNPQNLTGPPIPRGRTGPVLPPDAGGSLPPGLEKAEQDLTGQYQSTLQHLGDIDAETEARLKRHQDRADEQYEATAIQPGEFQRWDAGAESKKYQTDPIQAFGSLGSVFGMLASAFTRAPMENALNASAAAMNAVRAGDEEAYNRAHDAWKENTDLAFKRHNIERERLGDAMRLMDTDMAAGTARARMVMNEFGMQKELVLLENGMFPELYKAQEAKTDALNKTGQALQEIDRRNLQYATFERDRKAIEESGASETDIGRALLSAFNNAFFLGMKPGDERSQILGQYIAETVRQQHRYPSTDELIDENEKITKSLTRPYLGTAGGRPTMQGVHARAIEDIKDDLRHAHPDWSNGQIDKQAEKELREAQTVTSGNRVDDLKRLIDQQTLAINEIDKVEGMLTKSGALTGLGGDIRRPLETILNITGGSDTTAAKEFRGHLTMLKDWVAGLVQNRSAQGRPLSVEEARLATTIPGLSLGDTVQYVTKELRYLQKVLREQQQSNISRLPGGTWQEPQEGAKPSSKAPAWLRLGVPDKVPDKRSENTGDTGQVLSDASPDPVQAGQRYAMGDVIEGPWAAARSAAKPGIGAVGPPKGFFDRIWDNYAKRMTPEEFLQSESAWSSAKLLAEGQGISESEAFSHVANEMFSRMGATERMSPERARKYMGTARGIKAVPAVGAAGAGGAMLASSGSEAEASQPSASSGGVNMPMPPPPPGYDLFERSGSGAEPEARSYSPTWRDRVAKFILGDKPSYAAQQMSREVLGSSGLGRTGNPAAIDAVGLAGMAGPLAVPATIAGLAGEALDVQEAMQGDNPNLAAAETVSGLAPYTKYLPPAVKRMITRGVAGAAGAAGALLPSNRQSEAAGEHVFDFIPNQKDREAAQSRYDALTVYRTNESGRTLRDKAGNPLIDQAKTQESRNKLVGEIQEQVSSEAKQADALKKFESTIEPARSLMSDEERQHLDSISAPTVQATILAKADYVQQISDAKAAKLQKEHDAQLGTKEANPAFWKGSQIVGTLLGSWKTASSVAKRAKLFADEAEKAEAAILKGAKGKTARDLAGNRLEKFTELGRFDLAHMLLAPTIPYAIGTVIPSVTDFYFFKSHPEYPAFQAALKEINPMELTAWENFGVGALEGMSATALGAVAGGRKDFGEKYMRATAALKSVRDKQAVEQFEATVRKAAKEAKAVEAKAAPTQSSLATVFPAESMDLPPGLAPEASPKPRRKQSTTRKAGARKPKKPADEMED